MTAADVRANRERDARSLAVRKSVGVKVRVGRGLVALAHRDYERAGRELGEIGEEGGLEDFEGVVSIASLPLAPRSAVFSKTCFPSPSLKASCDSISCPLTLPLASRKTHWSMPPAPTSPSYFRV